jgi:hypothetical protein
MSESPPSCLGAFKFVRIVSNPQAKLLPAISKLVATLDHANTWTMEEPDLDSIFEESDIN